MNWNQSNNKLFLLHISFWRIKHYGSGFILVLGFCLVSLSINTQLTQFIILYRSLLIYSPFSSSFSISLIVFELGVDMNSLCMSLHFSHSPMQYLQLYIFLSSSTSYTCSLLIPHCLYLLQCMIFFVLRYRSTRMLHYNIFNSTQHHFLHFGVLLYPVLMLIRIRCSFF